MGKNNQDNRKKVYKGKDNLIIPSKTTRTQREKNGEKEHNK